jgi:ribosomal protein S27E
MKQLQIDHRQLKRSIRDASGCLSFEELVKHCGHSFQIRHNRSGTAIDCITCDNTAILPQNLTHRELEHHVGHEFECVTYGDDQNVSLECMDCSLVMVDFDHPDNPQP